MMFEAMQVNFNGAVIAAMLFFMLLFFGLLIFLTVFWILMIVDCAKRKKLSDSERVAWILILVFLHFIGATIYYFAVKKK
jgi:hypothetical protein